MKQITPRIRLLLAALPIALISGLVLLIPQWKESVSILNFIRTHWMAVLFGHTVLIVLLRRYIAQVPARPVSVFLVYFSTFCLTISWFLKRGVEPTLLLIVLLLHGTAILLTSIYEAALTAGKSLLNQPRYQRVNNWVGGLVASTLLLGGVLFYLHPSLNTGPATFLFSKLYYLFLIVPACTAYLRFRRRLPWNFVQGFLIIFLLGGWLITHLSGSRLPYMGGYRVPLSLLKIVLPFFVGGWLHLYYESWFIPLLALWNRIVSDSEKVKTAGLQAKANVATYAERFKEPAQSIGPWFKQHRRAFMVAGVLALAGLGLYELVPKIYQHFFVTVVEFTPSGEIENRTNIRVTFSDAVQPITGDVSRAEIFNIQPPLPGSYRQDAEKTISYLPTESLRPSTNYVVQFSGKNLTAKTKRLQGSAKTEFHTPYFAVAGAKIFYTYDIVTNEEREVTGEINFNYAVSMDELKKNIQVFREEDPKNPLPVSIEKSNVASRFYFKAGPIKREDKEQRIKLRLTKGMMCIGGSVGLAADYEEILTLPGKVKLEVAEVSLHHEPGNTLIAVLFNMPVSAEQIRQNVTITPALPTEIETEYCYAVLRGNFKPNVSYKIKINKGLRSKTGEFLERDNERSVSIRDLPPRVQFARRGNVLSLNGPKTIEVKTVNLDKVRVHIEKVFRNNLIHFLKNGEYDHSGMKRFIFSGQYNVDGGEINEEVTQHINLSQFHSQPYKGLFQIRLSDAGGEYYDRRDWAWFLCTDLGLYAKRSGADLIVNVVSVASLASKEGVTVELFSYDNQVIDRQVTDESGRVVFLNWNNNEFKFTPYFLVAKKDDDFSFLHFGTTELNQNQFGVGGDAYTTQGMEAFLTSERGVYRPGETAFITAVIRNADGSVPVPAPVRLIAEDPRGNEIQRTEARPNENGVLTFEVPFPADGLTGQYSLNLWPATENRSLGSTTLKVEEFIPDKLKVEVIAPGKPVLPGQLLTFTVQARQLFGPPAIGNKVEAAVRYMSSRFSLKGFESYTFEDVARERLDSQVELGQEQTDENGRKEYSIEWPSANPPSAIRAYLYAEVFDTGGRPVSAAEYATIYPYAQYLGLKQVTPQPLLTKKAITIEYVAISPDGKPETIDDVQLIVKRKAWYSIFRRGSWGRSGYTSSSYEELVAREKLSIKGKGSYSFTPEAPGDYSVILVSPNGMRSSVTMHVTGAGYETTSLESPEKLKIVLDKEIYDVGDTARVYVQAPFSGKLILTLEREKVLQTFTVMMTGKEQTFNIPIEERFLPNVYIVGLLARTPDGENNSLPMVSFGVTPVSINPGSRRISMSWDAPKAVQSADGIQVTLKVGGNPAETDVVLAAVDQGILQITNFETPSPLSYFYRKRGLTTQTYTMLSLLLPDVIAKKFAIGGDEGSGLTRRHLNPVAAKKKKSLALFSGLLKPDADGNVRYNFKTNGFNGEVRVMALAVRGRTYGSFSKQIQVADPIVLIPSLPRFSAPLDQFQIPVEVYNKTGADSRIETTVHVTGPVKITKDPTQVINLKNGEQKRLIFLAEAAKDAGVARFSIESKNAQHRSVYEEELSVRPFTHLVTVTEQGTLKGDGTEDLKIPAGFIPFGQRIRLSVSGNPLIKYLRSLDYLIGYPYGCAEQTTSKIFPLLFLKDLGFTTGRFSEKANAVDLYIQEGIKRLESMQSSGGLFSFWPGSNDSYRWLDQYVSHCLLEADRRGYKVSPALMTKVRRFIGETSAAPVNQGRLDRRQHNVNPNSYDAYQLFLKALIGKPDIESMTFMVKNQLKNLSETDRALLSMAYSQSGDRATAASILEPDFKSKFLYRQMYGEFNSPIRNTAIYLMALVQADPQAPKVPQIVEYLGSQLKNGHFGSTQENVWALMGLHQVYKDQDNFVKTELLVDGKPYKTLEGRESAFQDNALSGRNVTIRNAGQNKVYFHMMAEGTPLEKKTQSTSNGLSIQRSYFDLKGKKLNLSNVVQGELVIVTLTVDPKKDGIANLVIVDVLPGGFEIENPRLRSRGELQFEPAYGFEPAYQDIRDDRILLFSDSLQGSQSFSYTVRAVVPGRFTIPNAFAEAMYDPDVNSEYYEKEPLIVVDNNAGR